MEKMYSNVLDSSYPKRTYTVDLEDQKILLKIDDDAFRLHCEE